jgi:hypothetical protein
MRKTLPFFAAAVMVGLLVGSGLPVRAQEGAVHAPDGGTRQTVQSIVIPPATNAPFTATVTTELTRLMPDGSTMTNRNHRTVARDGSGRVFQERRYFTPDGDSQVTRLSELDYQDPNRHELYICHPAAKECDLYRYDQPATVALPKAGPLANGMGSVTLEDLGRKTIESLDVVGSREVTTISIGAIGNQKAEPIVKEFWYSPYLGINLITKRFDPRASAIQNFIVSGISLTEPDPKMFLPPTDFRVVKMDGQ